MEINKALCHLGKFGRWQFLNFFVLGIFSMSIVCFHMLAITYLAHTPPHVCKMGPASHDDENIQLGSCEFQYKASNQSFTNFSCQHGWNFYNYTGSTIVTEWDLVCDRQHMASLGQKVLVVGFMLGCLIFNYFIDKHGRIKVCFCCLLALGLIGSLNSLSSNIEIFIFFRFIIGFHLPGLMFSGYILLCESFPIHRRTFVGIFSQLFWVIAASIQPLVAYFIVNWRYYQLFISVCCFVFLPFFFFIRESVLWDISKGRIDHAEETLRIAAKMNRVTFNEPILQRFDQTNDFEKDKAFIEHKTLVKSMKNISFMKVFSNTTILFYLLAVTYLWLAYNSIYYDLVVATDTIKRNRFLNAFVEALVEVPGCLLAYLFMENFGRKKSLQLFYTLAAVTLWVNAFIKAEDIGLKRVLPYFMVVHDILNKSCVSAASITSFLYATEIFPTCFRARGLGISSFIGKFGILIGYFGAFASEKYGWISSLVVGCSSLAVAVMMIFLPETNNKPLPNTIQEACDLRRKVSKRQFVEELNVINKI